MDQLQARRRDESDHRAAQPAAHDVTRIQIISKDATLVDRVVSALSHPDIQVHCISNLWPTGPVNGEPRHDVVLLDVDGLRDAASVLRHAEDMNPSMILLCSESNLGIVAKALGGSSGNILLKPVDAEELAEAVRRIIGAKERTRRLTTKYRQMRDLVRRVVRERRDLNSRIDLVCRDLVEAHRRLTHRFVQLQKTQPSK